MTTPRISGARSPLTVIFSCQLACQDASCLRAAVEMVFRIPDEGQHDAAYPHQRAEPGNDDTKASGTGRGRTAVGIELKAGTRLRSAADACEVVVVKAPGEPVDLRCGGHPFVALDAEVTPQSIEPGSTGDATGQALRRRRPRARAAVHQGGRGLDLGRRDRARGQGGQAAARPRTDRPGPVPVNIAMLLEMAAEGDPDRVVVGSKSGGSPPPSCSSAPGGRRISFAKAGRRSSATSA